MQTVEEILRQTGLSDEQIKALDSKTITAFSGVLTEAEQAREAAELAQRSNVDFYENQIAPALNGWDQEKQRLDNELTKRAAEAAYYRTQNEEGRKSGFIPSDAPGFDPSKYVPAPARDGQGRYVAGAPGSVPGSPTFDVNQIYQRAGDAVGVLTDIQWEHQRLFNQPLPISPTELIRQADAVKLDPKTYASRTFNWDTRRKQMDEDAEKQRSAKIAAEAVAPFELKLKEADELRKKEVAEKEREIYERIGSNPDVRRPSPSQYSDLNRAVKANELPDPLSVNDQQRRTLTAQMIRKDIDASQQVA